MWDAGKPSTPGVTFRLSRAGVWWVSGISGPRQPGAPEILELWAPRCCVDAQTRMCSAWDLACPRAASLTATVRLPRSWSTVSKAVLSMLQLLQIWDLDQCFRLSQLFWRLSLKYCFAPAHPTLYLEFGVIAPLLVLLCVHVTHKMFGVPRGIWAVPCIHDHVGPCSAANVWRGLCSCQRYHYNIRQ